MLTISIAEAQASLSDLIHRDPAEEIEITENDQPVARLILTRQSLTNEPRRLGTMRGSVLYHCGPVVMKQGDTWRVTAAGPTTSIREEPYQGEIIKRYGVRAVIGKGGMGAKTLDALKEHGAVYLNAIGGAAQFYARTITSVDGVSLMEFGTPEAMWHLTVDSFPAMVTMDAHGNSLHKDVEQESGKHLEQIGATT